VRAQSGRGQTSADCTAGSSTSPPKVAPARGTHSLSSSTHRGACNPHGLPQPMATGHPHHPSITRPSSLRGRHRASLRRTDAPLAAVPHLAPSCAVQPTPMARALRFLTPRASLRRGQRRPSARHTDARLAVVWRTDRTVPAPAPATASEAAEEPAAAMATLLAPAALVEVAARVGSAARRLDRCRASVGHQRSRVHLQHRRRCPQCRRGRCVSWFRGPFRSGRFRCLRRRSYAFRCQRRCTTSRLLPSKIRAALPLRRGLLFLWTRHDVVHQAPVTLSIGGITHEPRGV